MNTKNCNILFIILVLVILFVPVSTMNLLSDQVSVTENRTLASFPSLSEGLTAFMNGIDSYIDDRIGFRENIMQLYNYWNYAVLNGNHSQVISADNGWLFFKDTLPDYTGTNIDPNKTATEVQILTAIDQWCKERNITFVFTVGPNKSTVYDQYMPDYVYHAPTSNLDMLLEALAETDLNVFCPKDTLIAHCNEQDLYLCQDTHWNSYGSRYLLTDIVEGLELPSYEIPISDHRASSGDLLTMQGVSSNNYTSLYTDVPYLEGTTIEDIDGMSFILHSPASASFVCYRDSFTESMLGFYSYYFSGPVYWDYHIDFDALDEIRPQYVFLSCVERYMDHAIYSNADIITRLENDMHTENSNQS